MTSSLIPGPLPGGGGGNNGSVPSFTESVLESAATSVSVSLSNPDSCYSAFFHIKTAAASNNVFFVFNEDTHTVGSSATNYNQIAGFTSSTAYNNITLSGNSSMLQNGSLGINEFASGTISISRFYDGVNTRFSMSFRSEIAAGQKNGHMTKTVSGNVPLIGFAIRSDKTNGLAAGSYIKPIA